MGAVGQWSSSGADAVVRVELVFITSYGAIQQQDQGLLL